jgi:hypothetical protein
MPLPVLSAAPLLDDARAVGVAGGLQRAAVAWAGTFLHARAGLDPALLQQLATETLAFGLALLDEQLRPYGPDAGPWAARVRRAAWTRHARWRRPARGTRLLTAGEPGGNDGAEDTSEFSVVRHGAGGQGGGEFAFTEAMVAEFCELTGLGTRELVGHGPNRAAMGFYLVVHGRVFAQRPDSREERRWLIQALRECREHLERAVDHWLTISPERPVSARIGR